MVSKKLPDLLSRIQRIEGLPDVSIEVDSITNRLRDFTGSLVFGAVPSKRGGWCVEVSIVSAPSSPGRSPTRVLTLFFDGDCSTAAYIIDLLSEQFAQAA